MKKKQNYQKKTFKNEEKRENVNYNNNNNQKKKNEDKKPHVVAMSSFFGFVGFGGRVEVKGLVLIACAVSGLFIWQKCT